MMHERRVIVAVAARGSEAKEESFNMKYPRLEYPGIDLFSVATAASVCI